MAAWTRHLTSLTPVVVYRTRGKTSVHVGADSGRGDAGPATPGPEAGASDCGTPRSEQDSRGVLRDDPGKRVVEVETDLKYIDDGYRSAARVDFIHLIRPLTFWPTG